MYSRCPETGRFIGEGGDKRVSVHADDETKVVAEFKYPFSAQEVKSGYYLAQIARILFPEHVARIRAAGTFPRAYFVVDKVTLDEEHKALLEQVEEHDTLFDELKDRHHPLLQEKTIALSEALEERERDARIKELQQKMDEQGLHADFDALNFSFREDGTIELIDLPMGYYLDEERIIRYFEEEKLRVAIADIEDAALRQKAERYFARLIGFVEEAEEQLLSWNRKADIADAIRHKDAEIGNGTEKVVYAIEGKEDQVLVQWRTPQNREAIEGSVCLFDIARLIAPDHFPQIYAVDVDEEGNASMIVENIVSDSGLRELYEIQQRSFSAIEEALFLRERLTDRRIQALIQLSQDIGIYIEEDARNFSFDAEEVVKVFDIELAYVVNEEERDGDFERELIPKFKPARLKEAIETRLTGESQARARRYFSRLETLIEQAEAHLDTQIVEVDDW